MRIQMAETDDEVVACLPVMVQRGHTLELDSGVQRFDAHRFYLVQRMLNTAHHFRLTLQAYHLGP